MIAIAVPEIHCAVFVTRTRRRRTEEFGILVVGYIVLAGFSLLLVGFLYCLSRCCLSR